MQYTNNILIAILTVCLVMSVVYFLMRNRSRSLNKIASKNSKFLMKLEDPDIALVQFDGCQIVPSEGITDSDRAKIENVISKI